MSLNPNQRNYLRTLAVGLGDAEAADVINVRFGWRKITPVEVELWLAETGAGELLSIWREANKLSLEEAAKPENKAQVRMLGFVRALLGIRAVNVDLAPGTQYRQAVDQADAFGLPVTADMIGSLLALARIVDYVDVNETEVAIARAIIQSEQAKANYTDIQTGKIDASLALVLDQIANHGRIEPWTPADLNAVEES